MQSSGAIYRWEVECMVYSVCVLGAHVFINVRRLYLFNIGVMHLRVDIVVVWKTASHTNNG